MSAAKFWIAITGVGSLSAMLGCGPATPTREKPTSDEIRQMRAQVEAEKPAAPSRPQAVAMAASVYRPWGVKETAVDALGRIGEVAVAPLMRALSDADPRRARKPRGAVADWAAR